jgi:hypothetical protein
MYDGERLPELAETLAALAGPRTVVLLATPDGAPGRPLGPVIDRFGVADSLAIEACPGRRCHSTLPSAAIA